MAETQSQTMESEERLAVFGEVVTVRPVPTRGVTQIVIEIPEEFHVAATQMLFRQSAYVFPGAANTSAPYGVKVLKEGEWIQGEGAPDNRSKNKNNSGTSGLNVTKWLALRCKEGDFQRFLKCESEIAAIDQVRNICEVESRSDIPTSEYAMNLFMEKIFTPYNKSQNSRANENIHRGPWNPLKR